MGYNEVTLHRVMDVLDYLGEISRMAPEAEQQPYPLPAVIRAMGARHNHSPSQVRRAVDVAVIMGKLCYWRTRDQHGDRRIKHVALTNLGLVTLREAAKAEGIGHTQAG